MRSEVYDFRRRRRQRLGDKRLHSNVQTYQSEYVELLSGPRLSVELLSSFPSGPPFYRNKGTGRAALGDVSDALSLRVRVLNG